MLPSSGLDMSFRAMDRASRSRFYIGYPSTFYCINIKKCLNKTFNIGL